MPTDWPQDTVLVRKQLARYLSGEGIDVGPGPHPFPVAYPGASIQHVDRWDPGENERLYPELVDASFPAPDVVCDLNVDLLSAFGDGKLDFVVASHVLEHVADPLGLLDDMHRVLQPDGVALILLPDRRLTFDSGRPATRIEALVRKHEDGVTAVADADIDDFLRYADPDAFGSLMATAPDPQRGDLRVAPASLDPRALLARARVRRRVDLHDAGNGSHVGVPRRRHRRGRRAERLRVRLRTAEVHGRAGRGHRGESLRCRVEPMGCRSPPPPHVRIRGQSVSAEVSALQSELDTFRSRRIVRDRSGYRPHPAGEVTAMKPVRQS